MQIQKFYNRNWSHVRAHVIVSALILMFVIASIAYAEAKTVTVYPGATSAIHSWDHAVGSSWFVDSKQIGGSDVFYWQSITTRGWSRNGPLHIVSEVYISGYNVANVFLPSSGATKGSPGYGTSKHFWQHSPYGGQTTKFTSGDGAHSNATCFYSGCNY